jgi:hypothetical protein
MLAHGIGGSMLMLVEEGGRAAQKGERRDHQQWNDLQLSESRA